MTEMEILSRLATGRANSLFGDDVENSRNHLCKQIRGRRFLVIGAGGSIGSSTVKMIAKYNPKTLHLIDQNENSLVEVVRDLRNNSKNLKIDDFGTWPLDFGAPVVGEFIKNQERYDRVLNFAAIKHVRSEKDAYSVVQMFDTNLVKLNRLLTFFKINDRVPNHFFCVSTDKAADPVNLMGASKKLMEDLMFLRCKESKGYMTSSTARFANVAFSNGSLLSGMLIRLQKRQPIALPDGCRRYFVSIEESGHLCLLASCRTPNNRIAIPRKGLRLVPTCIEEIAIKILKYFGKKPRFYNDETEACNYLEKDDKEGFYPILKTPLDTTGEKVDEIFVGQDETCEEIGLNSLQAVVPNEINSQKTNSFIDLIKDLTNGNQFLDKNSIVKLVYSHIKRFNHVETKKNLDDRM